MPDSREHSLPKRRPPRGSGLRVLCEDPLLVAIAKRGRPVSAASALAALRRAYPDTAPGVWALERADHSTLARRAQGE